MRASVDVILVVRQGGEHLSNTLRAIGNQSRPVGRLIVADTSADSTLRAQIKPALEEIRVEPEIIDVAYNTSWSEAVEEAMAHLFPEGQEIPESAWVWLLRDDIMPHPSALEKLALSVEVATLVKVAGPKQHVASQPTMIREMGESITRFGERMPLAEREMDQAQYDRLSDVLAVGEAGMLVHAPTFDSLEGFDPALSLMDGSLDFCIRARLSGHRVVVVPRAIVDVENGLADWSLRKKLSSTRGHYLARKAWLYRRLVYAPVWALGPLVLVAIPWSLLTALFHLVRKHPDRTVSEVAAALGSVLEISAVIRARGVLSRSRTNSWAVVNALRLAPEDVSKRRGIRAQGNRAIREEKASSLLQPPAMPALAWLVGALTVVAGMIFGRWWGASALLGGGLLPVAGDFDELWNSARSIVPTQLGVDAPALPADSAHFIFAALGSLTWWSPSAAFVWLFVAAIPIAGFIAWWGFSQVLSKAWSTALVSALWALSPSFLIAVAEGRVGAVISHLALPWLFGAIVTAHLSWQRVGQASLALLVVTAMAPVLWPPIMVAVIVYAVITGFSQPVRMFGGFLPLVLGPALLLGLPRFFYWWGETGGRWWQNGGVLFADPGLGVSFTPATWWQIAGGWPSMDLLGSLGWDTGTFSSALGLVLVAAGVLLVLIALASLSVARPIVGVSFALLGSLGLLTATAASAMFSGYQGSHAVFVWQGSAVSLMTLGVLVGVGGTLDRTRFTDGLGKPARGVGQAITRVAGFAVVICSLVAPGVIGWAVWNGHALVQPMASSRTLPAIVAAEAINSPSAGTLIIEPAGEGYLVTLERGAGQTLLSTSSLVTGRSTTLTDRDEDLSRLGAMLVRPSAADPTELFSQYEIRFILVKEPPSGEASLNLSLRPELVSASSGESGQLWMVSDTVVIDDALEHPGPTGLQRLFLALLAVVLIVSIPTDRLSRGTSASRHEALPTLGEDTSDDD